MILNYIIIISIFLLIWSWIFSKNIEHYDTKINNANEDECGIMCTKGFGCIAFSQGKNNTCYLSKTRLLGSPTESKFKEDYDVKFTKCNKVEGVVDAVYATPMDLKRNATYICNANSKDEIRVYDNEKTILNTLNDLDQYKLNEYVFTDIDWNKELNKNDHIDYYTNPNKLDFKIMKEYDDEYMGQYMYKHKCVHNTTQKDCINNCLYNDKCLGTEWNPLFYKKKEGGYDIYNGVCCPKIKITDIIPRRSQHKYGKFYLKEKYDKNDSYIGL
jgi:hypothetical protein